MARHRKAYQYKSVHLWREIALLLESGAAQDVDAAVRAVEHKASGSSYKDARRRRLKRQFLDNEDWLRHWARQQLVAPRCTGFLEAVRSMERGFAYMRWLERIVRERQDQERAMERLARAQEWIKREV